jgi:DNA-binding response OmpR family regulator
MAREQRKILLVDDEPDITYIVEFILSTAGFEVVRINDSRKAIPELLAACYDLLILDLMMPGQSGFEVLAELRKEKALDRLPVLILSSRQLTTEDTAFLASHHAGMMAKPFEPHRLLEKVREIVADEPCTIES